MLARNPSRGQVRQLDGPGRTLRSRARSDRPATHPTASRTTRMSATQATSTEQDSRTLTVLVYSDNVDTRTQVRMAVGRRPAADVPRVQWLECATPAAVVEAMDAGRADL